MSAPAPRAAPRAPRRGPLLLLALALIVWGLWAGISAALDGAYEDLAPAAAPPS